MTLRRVGALLLVLALVSTGCSVGRFIAGAPSPGGSGTRHENAGAATHTAATSHELLARRCAGCHVTPVPGEMSAAAWQASLERMKLRMRLPASEWDSLAAMPTRDAAAVR